MMKVAAVGLVALCGSQLSLSAVEASTPTAAVTAVGSLVTHTNQPSQQTESLSVSPAAPGDVLTLAVETKFPGAPSFVAASVTGGGAASWSKVADYLTRDGVHGQELWIGTVNQAGASTLTVTYTSGSSSGGPESATSLDLQEFNSAAGSSTIWSVDATGTNDDGAATTTPTYPTLTPTSTNEAYVGYLAVPGSVDPGPTSGVVYQTDARYNQTAYAVSVSSTLTPTASSSSQTAASIAMLLKASAPAPAAADVTAPSVPSGVTAGSVTSSQVALSWSASTDNAGGSGLAGYRVYRSGTTGALNASLLTSPAYTDKSVAAGTSYSYTVSAVDVAGNESARSTALSVATPAAADVTAPSVPSGVTAGSVTSSQVALSWSASTDNAGGSGLAGYRVYRSGTTAALNASLLTSPAYTDKSVAAGTSYSYTVSAVDVAGNESARSTALSVATPAAADVTAPSVPSGVTAGSVTSSQVALSWSASTDNAGGSGLAGYRVYRSGTTAALNASLLTSPAYTDKSVAAGTSYSYTVSAVDVAGNESARSTALSVATPAAADVTAPSVPSGVTAGSVTSSQVALSWSASTDNAGGSGLAGYRVYRSGTTAALNASLLTSPAYTDKSVAAGTSYSYTVSAVDVAGNESARSTALSVATPAAADVTAPSVPSGVTAGSVTSSQVALSWSASTDNAGGSGLAGYRVYRSGTTAALNASLLTSPAYTDKSVAAGTSYSYTVSAVDVAGNESARSTALSVATPAAAVAALTNGGFEAGSLSGWTPSGASSSIHNGGHSGAFSALLGSAQPTNGLSSISQTFTAPAASTSLSFWWESNCPDLVKYDWATASLTDNTAGTTITLLPPTCASSLRWAQITTAITAGHRYTLTLSNRDENYPGDATYTVYDDVAVL